jgi:hypothetical protein
LPEHHHRLESRTSPARLRRVDREAADIPAGLSLS